MNLSNNDVNKHEISDDGVSCSISLNQYQLPEGYIAPQRDFTLDGIEKGARIAVAMSGGVDSSVVAALMTEAGYDVVGITLQLYDHGEMLKKKGACCAGQDIHDAKLVAQKLNIPHYVLDYESIFKQAVIDDFADSYMRGETPIPCIRCNQKVKFKDLLQTAKELGAKALVTGHYVKRLPASKNSFDQLEENRSQMHQAFDKDRDQSYFLFTTTQEQLDYLRFPLGVMDSKTETRYHAKRFGLKVADKPDSQDICFVPNGNYASVVSKLRPGALDPGEIIHFETKEILGYHAGIINYTVGQRKGLGISSHDPLYVIKLDATNKQVHVGPREALATHQVILKEMNWLKDFEFFEKPVSCHIKIRSSAIPVAATIRALDENTALVKFNQPEYGVAFGQAGVCYNNGHLICGGWISQLNKNME